MNTKMMMAGMGMGMNMRMGIRMGMGTGMGIGIGVGVDMRASRWSRGGGRDLSSDLIVRQI